MKRGQNGQTTILMFSVILNVALVGVIFWLGVHNSRILMKSYTDSARERADVREAILKVLEGNDAQQMDALKSHLRLAIDVDRRIVYKFETGGDGGAAR